MTRRHVLSALGALTLTPILNGFDDRHTQKIIVAGFGATGKSVLHELKQYDNGDLFQPMMVETNVGMNSIVEELHEQRVVLVSQAFYPLAWKLLHQVSKQPNCCLNCSGYVVYPFLTASEVEQNLTRGQIPRWAYSYVDFVRLVECSDENIARSRWQLKFADKRLTAVERQVAYEILKIQRKGTDI